MTAIRVVPGNPHDFSPAELDDLRQHLREQAPGSDVVVEAPEEHGYGVTLYEVIQVIADFRGAGGDYVIAAVVYWLQRRWRRDKKRNDNPRPRSIIVLDAEGNKLRTINIDEPDGEPRDDD